ncbi:hypothetical protein TIFTF001_047664 [Ficus carica]|uniref:Uncharacterized protein n=1 Tax=Ficus carica TaxID=3494 RepID=A0AA87Z5H4_FICCA|nr:hypothetical protein TIFTF001_047645 [Ficus carica]GMN24569.1 hypothetical protein TIFTF001_047646 [Ficus carica]GMN24720.1 hypothetical protein TIFTF001_047663 [Ficus carica]GMN24741.1 hypothetical protein TIFTF001_047664 [Ficus carica]
MSHINELVLQGTSLDVTCVGPSPRDPTHVLAYSMKVQKHIKQGVMKVGSLLLKPPFMKPCKVRVRYLEDGTKVRVSRGLGASGSIIPRPEILKIRTTPRPTVGTYQNPVLSWFPGILQWKKLNDAKTGLGMPDL